jgi:hypothetical protein
VKPSEVSIGPGETLNRKLKFQVDDKAEPPITIEEALAATAANCRWHGGLIGQRGDQEGAVYICTACQKYWRFTKSDHPFWQRLRYPSRALP